MRNSLPVEQFCAENERDSNQEPKLREPSRRRRFGSVEERSAIGRRETETTPGRSRSDYAGISSEKMSENLIRRKPKVSWAR